MADNIQSSAPMKRLPIRKCRLCDVLASAPSEGSNGNFFESHVLGTIARVHVFGTVLDSYISDDKNYAFFALDDTTGVIRCKVFGNTAIVSDIKAGQMVDVIGRVREYNGERYIMPEIVRTVTDPNLETLRWLEILKALKDAGRKSTAAPEQKEVPAAAGGEKQKDETAVPKDARAKILEIIGTKNNGEGAEHAEIVSASGISTEIVDSVLSELLSEGTCYEPRPGKIKIL